MIPSISHLRSITSLAIVSLALLNPIGAENGIILS